MIRGFSRFETGVLVVAVVPTALCALVLWRALEPSVSNGVYLSGATHVTREVAALEATPALNNSGDKFVHQLTLTDLYDVDGDQITPRDRPPEEVAIDLKLQWQGASTNYGVQLSDNPSLSDNRRHFSTTAPELFLRRAFVGDNYWRVSSEPLRWSEVGRFDVHTEVWPAKIAFSRAKYDLSLGEDGARLEANWIGKKGYDSYLVEISDSAAFTQRAVWREPLARLNHLFEVPGEYYLRVRGVTSNFELTEYSSAVKVVVHPRE